MIIKEINVEKALSLTSISIADYVINPYRGCEFGCLYCYAKGNKNIKNKKWGKFVDVKINLQNLLEKELKGKKIKRVLLGSITEVYQQVEEKYRITRSILEVLSKKKIPVTILTKSPLVLRDIDILKENKKNIVCFTVNAVPDEFLHLFEPNSPKRSQRLHAIKELTNNGIDVYAHVGPLLPGFASIIDLVQDLKQIVKRIDFEVFNYATMDGKLIENVYKNLSDEFKRIYSSKKEYEKYCEYLSYNIESLCNDIKCKIHIHPFDDFFQNVQGQYEVR